MVDHRQLRSTKRSPTGVENIEAWAKKKGLTPGQFDQKLDHARKGTIPGGAKHHMKAHYYREFFQPMREAQHKLDLQERRLERLERQIQKSQARNRR